ncbi:MAG: hypothetical protein ACK5XN_07730, partial [Bacteroidota bacterium]
GWCCGAIGARSSSMFSPVILRSRRSLSEGGCAGSIYIIHEILCSGFASHRMTRSLPKRTMPEK